MGYRGREGIWTLHTALHFWDSFYVLALKMIYALKILYDAVKGLKAWF